MVERQAHPTAAERDCGRHKKYMKKSKAKNRKRAAAVAGAAICSAARPITPEDVVKEADRNYNLGRKHGIEESKPSLEASQRLLLKIANQQKEMKWVADKLKAHMSLVRYDIENWRAYPSYDQMATLVKALEMVKPPNDGAMPRRKTEK